MYIYNFYWHVLGTKQIEDHTYVVENENWFLPRQQSVIVHESLTDHDYILYYCCLVTTNQSNPLL